MFDDVRAEVSLRISRLNDFVAVIRDAESGTPSASVESPMRDAKGLVFVHLYGTFEWCLVNAVREANSTLQAHGIACSQLQPVLFGLALNRELDSIQDGKRGERWRKRVAVFSRVFDASTATFDEDVFPNDGSHMRVSQVETIWAVFGIAAPAVPDGKLIGRVKELVSHRNEIAHGRLRADEVGRRFTVGDLASRICDVQAYCQYVVSTLEDHVTKLENVSRV